MIEGHFPARKRTLRRIGVGVFCIVGTLVIGLYTAPLGHPLTIALARLLPFPAAQVGRTSISIRDVLRRQRAVKQALSVEDVSVEDILRTLISERLVHRIRKQYRISVPASDVDALITSQIATMDSPETFEENIRRQFHWSLARYKKEVLQPYTEARRVEEAIRNSKDIQRSKRDRILQAQKRLEAGDAFDAVVFSYSEDFSSVRNGDIGWWNVEDLPKTWLPAATVLEPGTISPIIEDERRFVLLRINEQKEETGRVYLSAVIVQKKTLADMLVDEAKKARVRILIHL